MPVSLLVGVQRREQRGQRRGALLGVRQQQLAEALVGPHHQSALSHLEVVAAHAAGEAQGERPCEGGDVVLLRVLE